MKPIRHAATLVLAAALAAGCGDNDNTGPTLSDLAGNWSATKAQFTLDANPAISLDVVQVGGTVTLVVTNDGKFTFTGALPGAPGPIVVTGTWEIDGNKVTVTSDEDPDNPVTGTFSLSNDKNTLSVTIEHTTIVDLTQDGQVTDTDAAELDARFDRVGT